LVASLVVKLAAGVLKMFSYDAYLRYMLPFRHMLVGYREALNSCEFAISRHDVEFDTHRALEMAKIENKAGIKSTYFFQVRSDAYNLASIENKEILFEIMGMGHEVGLHMYLSHFGKYEDSAFKREMRLQKKILSELIEKPVDSFSVHRPKPWFLEIREDVIGSMINAYGPSFFEYVEQPKDIKYFADSTHQWNYGEPQFIDGVTKYQILTHPDEWFEFPNEVEKNYHLTYKAHCDRFNKTLMSENKRFNNFGLIK
jgi:hypothetical protein